MRPLVTPTLSASVEAIFKEKRRVSAMCEAARELVTSADRDVRQLNRRCRCVCDEGCSLCEDQAADVWSEYAASKEAVDRAIERYSESAARVAYHAAAFAQAQHSADSSDAI